MEKKLIPALEFFEFKSSDELSNNVLQFINDLNLVYNEHNVAYMFDKSFFFEPLFDWFDKCLSEVEKFLQSDDGKIKYSLKITDCWVNRQNFGQLVGQHHHSLSLLSALYYLDNTSTPTKFRIPNYSFHDNGYFYAVMPKSFIIHEIAPEKGKLVIFPSHLQHYVDPHKQLSTRRTVAFNMFISGKSEISTGKLEINVSDVRSQHYKM